MKIIFTYSCKHCGEMFTIERTIHHVDFEYQMEREYDHLQTHLCPFSTRAIRGVAELISGEIVDDTPG